MQPSTRHAALRLHRNYFSVSSGKNSTDAAPKSSSPPSAPTAFPPATPSDGGALPPWLNRWLRLWDRESGTHEILRLKRKVNRSSLAFDDKQRQVSGARATLDRALSAFEESQTQHAQLLQSRDRWTSSQAMEFARLLEKEVRVRKQLENAKKDLATLESEQSRRMNEYMNDLRRRYHEEQLWQDKWRVYSTFGTWGLIALNSVVFLASQYLWRAREAQRMKDVQGLLEQNLMANEGTLRAVREQGRNPIERDNTGGSMAANEKSTDATEGSVSQNSTPEGMKHSELKSAAPSSLQNETANYWTLTKQFTTDVRKKLFLPENRKVDIPSAILGASVTGLAWLAVAVAFPSSQKGGGPQ